MRLIPALCCILLVAGLSAVPARAAWKADSPEVAEAARSAAGQISDSRYDRVIEYAGLRGDMVLLMGEEIVVPRAGPGAGSEVHRRFTDLWRPEAGRWRLTARQATLIHR